MTAQEPESSCAEIHIVRSGHVYLWDYEAGSLLKQFDLSDQPIRCASQKALRDKSLSKTLGSPVLSRLSTYAPDTMWFIGLPDRSFVKFIARKQWFVAGSDDMQIFVYNYNTMEKIKANIPTTLHARHTHTQNWSPKPLQGSPWHVFCRVSKPMRITFVRSMCIRHCLTLSRRVTICP